MIDFYELSEKARDFFSQRQKALLLSSILAVFFFAALIAMIFIPQKPKSPPSSNFKSEPLEADQELLLPQGVSIPLEYAVSRETKERWSDGQVEEWLMEPDQEAVKKLSDANDFMIKSLMEAAP